jgi:hypothetical protein
MTHTSPWKWPLPPTKTKNKTHIYTCPSRDCPFVYAGLEVISCLQLELEAYPIMIFRNVSSPYKRALYGGNLPKFSSNVFDELIGTLV